MIFNDIDYRKAYILAPETVEIHNIRNIDQLSIGGYTLYYSKIQTVHSYSNKEGKGFLVGYAFDIRNPQLSENEIMDQLLTSIDIVEELEYINGRYFFIVHKGRELNVYSDASQLKPLVYHKESKLLASHDSLIEELLKERNYSVERRSQFNHNELDFTRYEEIYKYNPSLSLDLQTFEFERIYPRMELIERTPKYTFNKMKDYLDNSIEWLKRNEQYKFLSMTGGIDSRVSAALTRELSNDIEYMTYTKLQKNLKTDLSKLIYTNDQKITKQMQQNLPWKHTIFNLDDFNPSERFFKENERVQYSNHSYKLANYYKNHRKFNDALHIKSTVFGMGKADFSDELNEKADNFSFYQECIHGLSVNFKNLYDITEEAPKYFERNLVSEGVTLNRHYFDLFHLESRMGNWHSALTLETDPETEEFIFMNSRKMIDFIQQPSLKERKEVKLYKLIIDNYWPLLLHFGINKYHRIGIDFLKDFKDTVEIRNNTFVEYNPHETTIERQQNRFIIQPSDDKAYVTKNYEFVIFNKNNKGNLSLRSNYSNEGGRGRIKVIIKGNDIYNEYDILDMNGGVTFDFSDGPILINITYDRDYKTASWQSAARLYCVTK